MPRVKRTRKEREGFLIKELLTELRYRVSRPKWTESPDAFVTVSKGKQSQRIGIEHIDYYNDTDRPPMPAEDPLAEAAGLVVLLKEDCQTCDGTGSMPLPKSGHLSTAAYVCSVCAGRGWNPTAQAIEWLVPLMVEMEPRYSGSYAAPREAARKVIIRLLSMGDTDG